MKKVLLFTAIAGALVLTSFTGVTPHAPVPFSNHATYEDASTFQNDCTGELMDYSGLVNFDIHGAVNGNKVSYNAHLNYQGITAVGETSGTVYHGSGQQNVSQTSDNIKGAKTYTAITNIKFVAAGKKNNFIIRMVYHYTINSKGEVTSTTDRADFGSCQ